MSHHKNPYQMMNRMRRLTERMHGEVEGLKSWSDDSAWAEGYKTGYHKAVEVVLEEIGPILEDPPGEPDSVVKIGEDRATRT